MRLFNRRQYLRTMRLLSLGYRQTGRLAIAAWKSNADPFIPKTFKAAGALMRASILGLL